MAVLIVNVREAALKKEIMLPTVSNSDNIVALTSFSLLI